MLIKQNGAWHGSGSAEVPDAFDPRGISAAVKVKYQQLQEKDPKFAAYLARNSFNGKTRFAKEEYNPSEQYRRRT